MKPSGSLFEVDEVFGLYADAYVVDELSNLIFISLWGRDTAVQELIARLTVATGEGGLEAVTLNATDGGESLTLWIKDRSQLKKLSGRMPSDNLFGEMAHLWLFDPLVQEPDLVNRRAYLLQMQCDDGRLWSLVRETCHLPLLDSWRAVLLSAFRERGWITDLRQSAGMYAQRLDLKAEALESVMTDLINEGQLQLI